MYLCGNRHLHGDIRSEEVSPSDPHFQRSDWASIWRGSASLTFLITERQWHAAQEFRTQVDSAIPEERSIASTSISVSTGKNHEPPRQNHSLLNIHLNHPGIDSLLNDEPFMLEVLLDGSAVVRAAVVLGFESSLLFGRQDGRIPHPVRPARRIRPKLLAKCLLLRGYAGTEPPCWCLHHHGRSEACRFDSFGSR